MCAFVEHCLQKTRFGDCDCVPCIWIAMVMRDRTFDATSELIDVFNCVRTCPRIVTCGNRVIALLVRCSTCKGGGTPPGALGMHLCCFPTSEVVLGCPMRRKKHTDTPQVAKGEEGDSCCKENALLCELGGCKGTRWLSTAVGCMRQGIHLIFHVFYSLLIIYTSWRVTLVYVSSLMDVMTMALEWETPN